MLKETRAKQVEKMIHAGLKNIYISQIDCSFDQFAVVTLEGLMLLEREEYLKSHEGNTDAGNGSYLRNFSSIRTNSLSTSIPRSRSGKFKPMLIDLVRQQKDQIAELALLLYSKGLSTREVSDVLNEFFGETMSRTTVNNLPESFHQIRQSWEERQLDPYYKVVFCDALYTSLKRGNSYSKEAVFLMYGLKEDNTRELLLIEVNPTEGSSTWGEYLTKLKKRGVEHIDLFVADGIVGFDQVVSKYYPKAALQRCVVHLQRNLLNKVRPRDKESFAYDIKDAFNNFVKDASKEEAFKKLEKVALSWKDAYPAIANKLLDKESMQDYLTYIAYPLEVRRMIYTNNSIENLNREPK
jgi:putative transposase